MAKTPRSERVRLFVALDLPDAARTAVAAWRDELVAGHPELRAVAPEALHVTLAFLGWRDASEVEAIAGASAGAAEGAGAPALRPTAVKAVPPRRPRLLALDLEDQGGRCGELQASLAQALEDGGFYRPEKRPFWPHITLARVKHGGRAEPPAGPPPPSGSLLASQLTLYRSTLRPQGALYEPLARLPLGDA